MVPAGFNSAIDGAVRHRECVVWCAVGRPDSAHRHPAVGEFLVIVDGVYVQFNGVNGRARRNGNDNFLHLTRRRCQHTARLVDAIGQRRFTTGSIRP